MALVFYFGVPMSATTKLKGVLFNTQLSLVKKKEQLHPNIIIGNSVLPCFNGMTRQSLLSHIKTLKMEVFKVDTKIVDELHPVGIALHPNAIPLQMFDNEETLNKWCATNKIEVSKLSFDQA